MLIRDHVAYRPPLRHHHASAFYSTESDASLLYTTDPAMALEGQKVFPIQGGFLLVRPDLTVYENLQAIVRKVGREGCR